VRFAQNRRAIHRKAETVHEEQHPGDYRDTDVRASVARGRRLERQHESRRSACVPDVDAVKSFDDADPHLRGEFFIYIWFFFGGLFESGIRGRYATKFFRFSVFFWIVFGCYMEVDDTSEDEQRVDRSPNIYLYLSSRLIFFCCC